MEVHAQASAAPEQGLRTAEHLQKTQSKENASEIFRPMPGAFPPLEKARAYRGELVFVDHTNRRGSLRIQTANAFRFNSPHPFALLPYAVVRYQGAPADLRDIPLGTVLHARAFLPPDPTTSPVPVSSHKRDASAAPPENHVLLLEDEPSNCLREEETWMLKEVEFQNAQGLIVAVRGPKSGGPSRSGEESMTLDAATRIWRGRECLSAADLVAEGTWPSEGKKSLGWQPALLGIMWKPTLGGVFVRFHISDIWLDETSVQRASQRQAETHRSFIRSRWMPAWVDAVEYGAFGRATVTATLFGGMDPSLYADFKPGSQALMNGAAATLKHTEGGTAGPSQMAARGPLRDVSQAPGTPPVGSSGIQIRFETDLITEGIRPTRIIRVRPASWPDVHMPREEYLEGSIFEDRFPSPAIFPKY
jgi:hypothetical protein